MDNISFIIDNNNTFYEIGLSDTLHKFIEFDFTYFWEQCIQFGIESEKQGRFDKEKSDTIKNLITKCHPYVEGKINTEYNDIVMDCVIEHICRTLNTDLDNLWNKYLSPESAYQKAIFTRVSQYRNNKAVNQWVNLIRLQKYAKAKTDFIFEGKKCSVAECLSRMRYYDLTFSVCLSETGNFNDEVPCVKRYTLTQMPDSVFMIPTVAREIYKKMELSLEKAPEPKRNKKNDLFTDSNAMDAYSYMSDIERPTDKEMYSAIENFRFMPDTVYLPNCLKAIIDLEFTKMLENGIILTKCAACGKYFRQEADYNGVYCNRVGKNGETCREMYEIEKEEKEDTDESEDEIVSRCKDIYENLSMQVGKIMSESEFSEWSDYLNKLKDNLYKENSSSDELEAFLDYTEKMYGIEKENYDNNTKEE